MSFAQIQTPREAVVLVAFSDLTRFASFASGQPLDQLFSTLSDYYLRAGDIVEPAGGRIVKFIGDAILIVFPEDLVSTGVQALLRLREEGDAWLAEIGVPCRQTVKCHIGPVYCGPIGTRDRQQFDLFGETVNIAATLKSQGFAITPQVFRRLDARTRKLLKKQKPPITCTAAGESDVD